MSSAIIACKFFPIISHHFPAVPDTFLTIQRVGVVGARYKCLDCSNFDLCSTCYAKGLRNAKHDLQHTFGRILQRGGVIQVGEAFEEPEEVRSTEGAKEEVETTPVASTAQEEEATKEVVDTEEAVELPTHAAHCDLCNTTIRGIRHKCKLGLPCSEFKD